MSAEVRLELLRLTKPNVDNPNIELWLKRAKELEAYVIGAGSPSKEAPREAGTLSLPEVRNTRPVAGPAQRK